MCACVCVKGGGAAPDQIHQHTRDSKHKYDKMWLHPESEDHGGDSEINRRRPEGEPWQSHDRKCFSSFIALLCLSVVLSD